MPGRIPQAVRRVWVSVGIALLALGPAEVMFQKAGLPNKLCGYPNADVYLAFLAYEEES